jgi:hypothetical protein
VQNSAPYFYEKRGKMDNKINNINQFVDEFREVALRTMGLNGGGTRKRIVDLETGEILSEFWEGSIDKMFDAGYNAVQKNLMIGRERLDTGAELIVVTDYEGTMPKIIISGWRSKNKHQRKNAIPKHTGGKPSYIKLYSRFFEKLQQQGQQPKLKDAEIGTALRIAAFADWKTGKLIDKKTKKPLNLAALSNKLGYSKRTMIDRVEALQENGIIKQRDGCYYMNREYFAKS